METYKQLKKVAPGTAMEFIAFINQFMRWNEYEDLVAMKKLYLAATFYGYPLETENIDHDVFINKLLVYGQLYEEAVIFVRENEIPIHDFMNMFNQKELLTMFEESKPEVKAVPYTGFIETLKPGSGPIDESQTGFIEAIDKTATQKYEEKKAKEKSDELDLTPPEDVPF